MRVWTTYEMELAREMVVEGCNEEEIALKLKSAKHDLRDLLRVLGLKVDPLAKLEWCDCCSSWRSTLDDITGWCLPCTTRHKLELQRIADEEEEARLAETVTREANVLKKKRERMRETYDANPRKGRKSR